MELFGIKYDKNNTKVDKIKTALDFSLFIKKNLLDHYNKFKISITLIDNTVNLQNFTQGPVATCQQIKLIYNLSRSRCTCGIHSSLICFHRYKLNFLFSWMSERRMVSVCGCWARTELILDAGM